MEKVQKLIEILEKDLDACDFKWTLFAAAANSYKHDSLLKPFPTTFADGKSLDVGRLRENIAKVPAFMILLDELRSANQNRTFDNTELNEDTIDLLHWCLICVCDPFLKSVKRSNVS